MGRLLPAALALLPPLAGAAGFALSEHEAAGLGRAEAGAAALRSPAAVAVNPAAVPDAPALSASWHRLAVELQPEAAGGTHDTLALYGSRRGLGLGLDTPYGLATRYPAHWSGREAALESEVRSLRLHLSGARALTPTLRLGVGVFAEHFAIELTNAVPTPGGDRVLSVQADNLAPGWSAGLLWTPGADLALGLGYTAAVHHRLAGEARLPLGARAARLALTTPEVATLGLALEPSAPLRLLAGATWTRWSRLQALDLALADGAHRREDQGWRDTWRLALGLEHTRGPWVWRGGLAWDQSPVPDAWHRSPRLPDADRLWLALGVDRRLGPWTLSLGYAHLHFPPRSGVQPPLDYAGATDILALGVARTW